MPDKDLIALMRAAAAGKDEVLQIVAATPSLAVASVAIGATRQTAKRFYLSRIQHYIYAGDTALHIAAAAYQLGLVRKLLDAGADIAAGNRHGQQPLHYAAMGMPGSQAWNPRQQSRTIQCLLAADADPNVADKRGTTPLHVAARTRCAAAVAALLEGGADPRRKNRNGSTPLQLAEKNSGRGGTGSRQARAEQEEILRELARH